MMENAIDIGELIEKLEEERNELTIQLEDKGKQIRELETTKEDIIRNEDLDLEKLKYLVKIEETIVELKESTDKIDDRIKKIDDEIERLKKQQKYEMNRWKKIEKLQNELKKLHQELVQKEEEMAILRNEIIKKEKMLEDMTGIMYEV